MVLHCISNIIHANIRSPVYVVDKMHLSNLFVVVLGLG
jgi:hypothetical protein